MFSYRCRSIRDLCQSLTENADYGLIFLFKCCHCSKRILLLYFCTIIAAGIVPCGGTGMCSLKPVRIPVRVSKTYMIRTVDWQQLL